jgi:hypothetical protein
VAKKIAPKGKDVNKFPMDKTGKKGKPDKQVTSSKKKGKGKY